MPTKAYKKKPKKPTWAWIYGDELNGGWGFGSGHD